MTTPATVVQTPPVIVPPAVAGTGQTMTFAEYESKLKQLSEDNARYATEATAASARVAKLEKAARTKRFSEIVDGAARPDGHAWIGDRVQKVSMLETMADKLGEDSAEFKAYVTEQNGIAEQMAASVLFREAGRDGSALTDGSGSAVTKAEAIAKQYREADPKMTQAKAMSKVWSENPQLYVDYEKETARRIKNR